MSGELTPEKIEKIKEQMDRRKKYQKEYYQRVTKQKRREEKEELKKLRSGSSPIAMAMAIDIANTTANIVENKLVLPTSSILPEDTLEQKYNNLLIENNKLAVSVKQLSIDNNKLQEILKDLRRQNFDLMNRLNQNYLPNFS